MPPAPVEADATAKPSNSRASVSPRTRSGSSSISRILHRSVPSAVIGPTLRAGLGRNPEPEARSDPAQPVGHLDPPAVGLRDVLDQRQPDARAPDRLD